jgi:hypothetical protein
MFLQRVPTFAALTYTIVTVALGISMDDHQNGFVYMAINTGTEISHAVFIDLLLMPPVASNPEYTFDL